MRPSLLIVPLLRKGVATINAFLNSDIPCDDKFSNLVNPVIIFKGFFFFFFFNIFAKLYLIFNFNFSLSFELIIAILSNIPTTPDVKNILPT